MPWKETCAMETREEFVLNALEESQPFANLCQDFGVSRKTGYKWLSRYVLDGKSGLVDGRRLRVQPRHYCDDVYQTVLDLRRMKPSWGPKKLAAFLQSGFSEKTWPSPSTIKLWLRDEGLSSPPRRRRFTPFTGATHRGLTMEEPNDVWCADYKGKILTGDRKVCEPLTVMDGASRYFFTCYVGASRQFKDIRCELERLFSAYGKPAAMLTDNGAPFGSPGVASMTPMAVWLIKQGVWPAKTRVGHPQDNGRLERLHRTLKAETAKPPAQTLQRQLERFEAFRLEYNNERPHEALGQRTPASRYVSGAKNIRVKYEYPSSMLVLRVDARGHIRWKGEKVYLTECLGREHIGVIQEDEQRYRLEFLGYPLATIKDGEKVQRL